MDSSKFDEAIFTLLDVDLPGQDDFIEKVGEMPYRANRAALRQFDIKNNEKMGRREVDKSIFGIGGLLKALETFENDSWNVIKRATAVHSLENGESVEEDSS